MADGADDDMLVVQLDDAEGTRGWARLGERRWRCVLGAGGVREDKLEGDGATPVGLFPLRRIYYRNDRLVLPPVALPARPIGERDGWCDDPQAPVYNRLVRLPCEWSAERLHRDDELYDALVVVGYNDDPPEGEWGSAIFIHVAREDFSPTRGCVALARGDLLDLLPHLKPTTRLRVLAAQDRGPPVDTDGGDMRQFEDFDERDW